MYIIMYMYLVAKRYSIADARAQLPSIVDQVEAGQEIELTRRGKPVAVVMSLKKLEQLRSPRPSFTEEYKKFWRKHSLSEVGLDQDYFDALRDRSPGRKVKL